MTSDLAATRVVYTDADGVEHVQTVGPAHVVEGSETVIDLPPGATVTRRRIPDALT